MKKVLFFLVIIAMTSFSATAQINAPAASPEAILTQVVGLTTIKIEYSRPGLKGRQMFGGLLPYGEMWRTGANAATKITIGDNAQIHDNDVPAGTYALYTIPGEEEWTIIFHKNTTHWGIGGKNYKKSEDAFRFKVKPTRLAEKVETFTIDINNIRSDNASIDLMWENTKVSFTINLDSDAKVMADIKQKMKGVSGTTYYQAAKYYYDNKKDLDQALEWVQIGMEKEGEKFWMMRLKALILADQQKYKKAMKAAERSIVLAEEEGNDSYVEMNRQSIAEWEKLDAGTKK